MPRSIDRHRSNIDANNDSTRKQSEDQEIQEITTEQYPSVERSLHHIAKGRLSSANQLLSLQRVAGNQIVRRLLAQKRVGIAQSTAIRRATPKQGKKKAPTTAPTETPKENQEASNTSETSQSTKSTAAPGGNSGNGNSNNLPSNGVNALTDQSHSSGMDSQMAKPKESTQVAANQKSGNDSGGGKQSTQPSQSPKSKKDTKGEKKDEQKAGEDKQQGEAKKASEKQSAGQGAANNGQDSGGRWRRSRWWWFCCQHRPRAYYEATK